jgi:CubicO group peptidase (beta-lactamase class C family)
MTRNHALGCMAVASFALLCSAIVAQAQPANLDIGPAPSMDVTKLAPGGAELALEQLDETVRSIMERSGVPGVAVAVVQGGQTVFAQGYGVRKLGVDDPVAPQTVFQIASVSKPLAATVAAIAVTQDQIAWDDLVTTYLPEFGLGDDWVSANLTIGDLYAHRSGLPLGAGDDLEDLGFSRTDVMARLHYQPLDTFRTSYHYANFGITSAAQAIATATGKSWEDLSAQSLYAPLGMDHTSSRYADFQAEPDRASLHALVDGSLQPLYERNGDAQSPAGGVSSNVIDLAEWLKVLLADGVHDGEQLIDPAALQAALSPQSFSSPGHVPSARPGFYGYGFNVGVGADGRTTMGHSGAFTLGAATRIQFVPSADIGIIVLTNAGPVGAAEAIASTFLDTVLFGAPTRDWYAGFHGLMAGYYDPVGDLADSTPPTEPAPAQALDAYVGTYQNDYFGPLEIVQVDGALIAQLGPRGDSFPLTHWDGDVFAVEPRNENAPYGSKSSVSFDLTGETVNINYLDGNGLATWQR